MCCKPETTAKAFDTARTPALAFATAPITSQIEYIKYATKSGGNSGSSHHNTVSDVHNSSNSLDHPRSLTTAHSMVVLGSIYDDALGVTDWWNQEGV